MKTSIGLNTGPKTLATLLMKSTTKQIITLIDLLVGRVANTWMMGVDIVINVNLLISLLTAITATFLILLIYLLSVRSTY